MLKKQKNKKSRYLVVTMLLMSQRVENIYIVEAESKNDAHKQCVKYGFVSIIKNIDKQKLPLKVFKTLDEG